MELTHSRNPKNPGCRSGCRACRVEAAHKAIDIKGAFSRRLTAEEGEATAAVLGFKNLRSKLVDGEKHLRSSLGLRAGKRNKEGELEL